MERRKWIIGLLALLSTQNGEGKTKVATAEEEDAGDDGAEEAEDGDEGEGEESNESGEEGEEGSEEESEDPEDGSEGGEGRSKFIPRKRFDKVNAKATKFEKLIAMGIISEDEEGEIRINPEVLKQKKTKGEEGEEAEGSGNFYFSKDEVDEGSWPLVQKINKGFKHYENMANKMAFHLVQLQSENAILRDYPEFLQKDSPLRKRALAIMKDDPEFKKTYRGNPERGYWAVKRAAELLSGKSVEKKPKPKSKFIVGKGDADKGGIKKAVDFSKMSREELDNLEKKEHERLSKLRTK